MQSYGPSNTYTWTPTAADVGSNAVRVSVRNAGSVADFEDTATLPLRVVEGEVGRWQSWFAPRVPVALGVDGGALAVTSPAFPRRHSLYSPELHLLAETEVTSASKPPIEYDYVWFAGQPLAQITTATGEIHWYFNDHLGTPILQTAADAAVVWRVEYDPYGTVFATRSGADKHQPLRFPGQEHDGASELEYNIFRWYRAGWGRYTQSDPIGVGGIGMYALSVGPRLFSLGDAIVNEQRVLFGRQGTMPSRLYTFAQFLKEDPHRFDIGTNGYAYVSGNPVNRGDPLGLLNEDNIKPQFGKPYCDFGVCTPKVCPPKPCESMYQCMKKCVGNSTPPWPIWTAWGMAGGWNSVLGKTNAAYSGGVLFTCTVHCAATGCYPDDWLAPW